MGFIFFYHKANRRFLVYLGQLTSAFKLSCHLILQTSCKQLIKKGHLRRTQPSISRLLSTLNPKGRNEIEIQEKCTDNLTATAALHMCFSFALCTKLSGQKTTEKRANRELRRGSHLWYKTPPHCIGLTHPGMMLHILECHLPAFLSLCYILKPTPVLKEQSGCSQALEKCLNPNCTDNPSPVPLHRCIATHVVII